MAGRSWLVVALLLAGCARDNPDAGRVAALEARVRELEAQLDGGVSVDPDATVAAREVPAPEAQPRLSGYWPAGEASPEQIAAECRRHVSQQCRQVQRSTIEGGAPGQLTWGKERRPEAAAPDPACVTRHERECKQRADQQRQRNKVFPWLEQQLTANELDREFASQALQRLSASHSGHRVQLACTDQFCKAWLSKSDDGAPGAPPLSAVADAVLQHVGDGGSPRELLAHDGAVYIARDDYRFPDMNARPPGPLGRRR